MSEFFQIPKVHLCSLTLSPKKSHLVSCHEYCVFEDINFSQISSYFVSMISMLSFSGLFVFASAFG